MPPAPEDGTRILVMRRWPRGVSKDCVHAWDRHLGPSEELLDSFLRLENALSRGCATERANLAWNQLMARYIEEMWDQQESPQNLKRRHQAGEVISLLCTCHDPARCHRTMLAKLILGSD